MNKSTVLMAAILTVTLALAAGLTVLPNFVQEAEANPCATEGQFGITQGDNEGGMDDVTTTQIGPTDARECNLIGNTD
jgi:hypothetical protein